jgi:hypothetical protein
MRAGALLYVYYTRILSHSTDQTDMQELPGVISTQLLTSSRSSAYTLVCEEGVFGLSPREETQLAK